MNAAGIKTYHLLSYLISPKCRIYVSVNWVSFGSAKGLSPDRRQAITLTNADLFLIRPIQTNFS